MDFPENWLYNKRKREEVEKNIESRASMNLRSGCYFLLLLLLLASFRCKQEEVPEPYIPTNAHESYRYSLEQTNLASTALGRDWIAAAEKAMNRPVEISPPFEEVFYVDPAAAFAVGYRFSVLRGQRMELEVTSEGLEPARLFIDLFRVRDTSPQEWPKVASADKDENRFEFEPKRDAQYVVRLQPELLRGGRFRVVIRNVPSLEFPVAGKDSRAIQSGFGAPRDGGRRVHRGVDIFARRHTPVIAPSKAYVERVGEGDVGGRNIWLYDSKRSLYLYFAHLQTQSVKQNTWVEPGQTIGTVGNTGNAKTTPPHLHFAIYIRGTGAVDPYYFITKTNSTPPPVAANLHELGQWVRSKTPNTKIKTSIQPRSPDLTSIDRFSPMKILAAAGRMYRVMLPDGITGYVLARSVESIHETLELQEANSHLAVKACPAEEAAAKELIEVGDEYSVLGEFGGYLLVRTQHGSTGWLQIPSEPLSRNH